MTGTTENEAEAVEGSTILKTAETLTGDLRDALLDIVKTQLPKPWQQMSESEQHTMAHNLDQLSRELMRQACRLIAADGRDVILAKLKDGKIGDGLTFQITTERSRENLIRLGMRVGQHISIIFSDATKYEGETAPPEIDADQTDLAIDGGPPADEDDQAQETETVETPAETDLTEQIQGDGPFREIDTGSVAQETGGAGEADGDDAGGAAPETATSEPGESKATNTREPGHGENDGTSLSDAKISGAMSYDAGNPDDAWQAYGDGWQSDQIQAFKDGWHDARESEAAVNPEPTKKRKGRPSAAELKAAEDAGFGAFVAGQPEDAWPKDYTKSLQERFMRGHSEATIQKATDDAFDEHRAASGDSSGGQDETPGESGNTSSQEPSGGRGSDEPTEDNPKVRLGGQAYANGYLQKDNPYAPGSEAHAHWASGWTASENEAKTAQGDTYIRPMPAALRRTDGRAPASSSADDGGPFR